MLKTIGVLAHVDAGKTTFSEQLLYHAKAIRETGRVDHKNSFLDSHAIEKERGITVFSDQATFRWNHATYTLMDTPGHVDFSPEMERSIQVMDYAILIISAVDGIQGHTETVWKLLRKHHVPTFIFINKTDREEASVERVIGEMNTQLSNDIFDLSSFAIDGSLDEEGIEWIAERDEEALLTYVQKGYEPRLWNKTIKRMINAGEAFPFATGSGLKDIGVYSFLEKLDLLTETTFDEQASFSGQVYKIKHDIHGNRFTYIKAMTGTLAVREDVQTRKEHMEKITQIQAVHGDRLQAIDRVRAGELFAVVGLENCQVGDVIGNCIQRRTFELIPTLKARVMHDETSHVKEVLRMFQMLDVEEPSLHVQWDAYFQAIYVHVMGVIQLEILEQVIAERFSLDITFGAPEILYKETIETEIVGYGHFEPLRHYAEVHLKMEPAKRNSGNSFSSVCHPNDLPLGYQHIIQQHVLERDHHGLLTGSPVTDLTCTLLIGRAHQEHTSGGDFKEAVYRALRQGLEKATNVLLEPYYNYVFKVEQAYIGRIMSDVQRASGTFEPPESMGDYVYMSGRVPVATFMDYPITLASLTKGKGVLTLTSGGYDRCHNTEEIIAQMDYDKDADPTYTSSSIFCAKGKGYSVSWEEAENMMHCL